MKYFNKKQSTQCYSSITLILEVLKAVLTTKFAKLLDTSKFNSYDKVVATSAYIMSEMSSYLS